MTAIRKSCAYINDGQRIVGALCILYSAPGSCRSPPPISIHCEIRPTSEDFMQRYDFCQTYRRLDIICDSTLTPGMRPLCRPSVFESKRFTSGLTRTRYPSRHEVYRSIHRTVRNWPAREFHHPGSHQPAALSPSPSSRASCGSRRTQAALPPSLLDTNEIQTGAGVSIQSNHSLQA